LKQHKAALFDADDNSVWIHFVAGDLLEAKVEREGEEDHSRTATTTISKVFSLTHPTALAL